GQFSVRSFPVTVSAGSLQLDIRDLGGVNPTWVINALMIQPLSTVIPIRLSGPGSVPADGATVDTITGQAPGEPDGTLLTVTSSLGTILTDTNIFYSGSQVVVNQGHFDFQIKRPTGADVPTLTATAIDGTAFGTAMIASVLNYSLPTMRRFDFN